MLGFICKSYAIKNQLENEQKNERILQIASEIADETRLLHNLYAKLLTTVTESKDCFERMVEDVQNQDAMIRKAMAEGLAIMVTSVFPEKTG